MGPKLDLDRYGSAAEVTSTDCGKGWLSSFVRLQWLWLQCKHRWTQVMKILSRCTVWFDKENGSLDEWRGQVYFGIFHCVIFLKTFSSHVSKPFQSFTRLRVINRDPFKAQPPPCEGRSSSIVKIPLLFIAGWCVPLIRCLRKSFVLPVRGNTRRNQFETHIWTFHLS